MEQLIIKQAPKSLQQELTAKIKEDKVKEQMLKVGVRKNLERMQKKGSLDIGQAMSPQNSASK